MQELLEEMLSKHGPSGYENEVRDAVKSKVKGKGQVRTDNIGNLILELGSGEPHFAVVAHMDELGFVITKIDDSGRLFFRKIGGIDDRMLPGSEILVLGEYGPVAGVIGIKPPHLMLDRSDVKKTVSSEKLYIDVGTKNREDATALGIDISTPAVFEKRLRKMAHNVVSSRGMDNRFGVSALLKLTDKLAADESLKGTISLVWSVQEEVGLRGAQVIANTLKPDYIIALDTCSATDIPNVPSVFSDVRVGEGPVLRIIDNRAMASPLMREVAEEYAKKRGISLQYAISGGSTDGAAVQVSGSAMMPICVPVRYTHSKVECCSTDDMVQAVDLCYGLMKNILS